VAAEQANFGAPRTKIWICPLGNYDILTTEEKNRLWKLLLKKATLYRTPAGELSVHIYPKLPK
jgi:hypothetical protein